MFTLKVKFFTRRVINYWNYLTDVVGPLGYKSFNTFKIKLDDWGHELDDG